MCTAVCCCRAAGSRAVGVVPSGAAGALGELTLSDLLRQVKREAVRLWEARRPSLSKVSPGLQCEGRKAPNSEGRQEAAGSFQFENSLVRKGSLKRTGHRPWRQVVEIRMHCKPWASPQKGEAGFLLFIFFSG